MGAFVGGGAAVGLFVTGSPTECDESGIGIAGSRSSSRTRR